MKSYVWLFCFLLSQTTISYGQFRWEDPLAVANIGIADKYGLLYNIAGLAVSEILAADKPDLRPWESTFSLEYQQAYGTDGRSVAGYIGRAQIGKQFQRWVQAGLEGQLMLFEEGTRSSTLAGGGLYFNWLLLKHPGFRLSADFGYGIALGNKAFPQGGTRFNFTRYYGLHVAFRMQSGTLLQLGLRTFHLSNAYLFGDDRNPAFDSIGILVGVTFPLCPTTAPRKDQTYH